MAAERLLRLVTLRGAFAPAGRPAGDKPAVVRPFAEMAPTLKRASAALRGAGVDHALTGAPACWAYGGPETGLDWDLIVLPADAERAARALRAAGLRVERPPEGWLLKAWDGDVLVDLIFHPLGDPVEDCMSRATEERVVGLPILMLSLTDVFISMLLARNELFLEYERLLQAARPVRERVDWDRVREATAGSPYAAGFLALLEALRLISPPGPVALRPSGAVAGLGGPARG